MHALLFLSLSLAAVNAEEPACVLIVVGTPGASEYEVQFHNWAERWQAAAKQGGAHVIRIGLADDGDLSDRERLRRALEENAVGNSALWLVLIGHGTFDGREAKFNLRGPDISAAELADWLAAIDRPMAVINTASASGPFLRPLSSPNRIVLTATRSGDEQNFARFGGFLAEAIADPEADLDKDGQVSLLEAFLKASQQTAEFYSSRSRLATEHALLDDNGDGLGTPADWFRGVRAMKRARDGAAVDGPRAHQFHLVRSDREHHLTEELRRRRDQLELAIATLRDEKDRLPEDDYYDRLRDLMLELARLYRDAENRTDSP
jgi:hypothetical protein